MEPGETLAVLPSFFREQFCDTVAMVL